MEELNILNKLFTYINDTKDEKLELKPKEFETDDRYSNINSSTNVEIVKKDNSTIISKENKIICANIIEKFLTLKDEKFMACLEKIQEWGFELCMKKFIVDYYLYVKNDNNLRQYITMHIDTLINILKDELEAKLLSRLSSFNFMNSKDDYEIQALKNDLKNKQTILLGVKAMNFNEDSPISEKEKEKLEVSEKNDLRTEILNNLRKSNAQLEEML